MRPDFGLQGKVALVTGGGRGLGKAMALGLAGARADVAVSSRTLAECQLVAQEIERMGTRSLALKADVRRPEECEAMVQAVVQERGRLDILINNAGTNVRKATLEMTEEDYDLVMDTNVKGLFFCCVAGGRVMVQQGGGKIINISSESGYLVRPGQPDTPYGAAKAAVIMITKILAVEWAPYNVHVNAIAPGFFEAGMGVVRLSDPKIRAEVMEFQAIKRPGKPEDLVGPVLFLASPLSDYVTGATLFVDGGRCVL